MILRLLVTTLLLLTYSLRAEEPARYVIYAATVFDEANQKDVKRLFKIDTTTGKTWEFHTLTYKPRADSKELSAISGWTPVDDDLMATIMKHQNK